MALAFTGFYVEIRLERGTGEKGTVEVEVGVGFGVWICELFLLLEFQECFGVVVRNALPETIGYGCVSEVRSVLGHQILQLLLYHHIPFLSLDKLPLHFLDISDQCLLLLPDGTIGKRNPPIQVLSLRINRYLPLLHLQQLLIAAHQNMPLLNNLPQSS